MNISKIITILCLFAFRGHKDPVAMTNSLDLQNQSSTCLLPPHPSFGKWTFLNQSLYKILDELVVPEHTILEIHCNETFKLDNNCGISVCIKGTWFPRIGKCLKTCPSISSTQTMDVSCTFQNGEIKNCTEPTEKTRANFECADFYENSGQMKNSFCLNGKWKPEIPTCKAVCGMPSLPIDPTLITGGKKVKQGQFPWQVALYSSVDKKLLCGGTILREQIVLTAAHCITNGKGVMYPKEDYVIVAGSYYRLYNHPEDSDFIQISQVYKMITPELYHGADRNFAGDIAIIVTKGIFKYTNRIRPICLDWSKSVNLPSDKIEGYVVGWGLTSETSNPADELKSIKIPILPRKKCDNELPEFYLRYMTSDKMCAGYKAKGIAVCQGDSGGGLVFQRNNRYYIGGIVSIGTRNEANGGCNSQHYGIFTSINEHMDTLILENYDVQNTEDLNFTTDEPLPTEPTPTTITETSTFPTIPENCRLPQEPLNGEWNIYGDIFGKFALEGTYINLQCEDDYDLHGNANAECINGRWSVALGQCFKMCPSLNAEPDINITCTYKSTTIDCSRARDGTVARYHCAPFYEISDDKPIYCLNGNWTGSSIPECIPECGKISTENSLHKHYPWIVTVFSIDDDRKFHTYCLGTLIRPDRVLIDAGCLSNHDYKKERLYVVPGEQFHGPPNDTQRLLVEDIAATDFIVPQSNPTGNNIGFLTTETPFILSETVRPICIDWKREVPQPKSYIFYAVQYNSGKYIKTENIILKNNRDQTKCVEYFIKLIFSSPQIRDASRDTICIIPENDTQISCSFNGGNLLQEYKNRYYLIGINIHAPLDIDDSLMDKKCVHKLLLWNDIENYLGFITTGIWVR